MDLCAYVLERWLPASRLLIAMASGSSAQADQLTESLKVLGSSDAELREVVAPNKDAVDQ